MDKQIEKICGLSKELCDRGAYKEAWDALYTVYKYVSDAYVLDIMAEYFFVPNKAKYSEKYENNISFFTNNKIKLFGFNAAESFNDKAIVSKMLWKDEDNHILYYLGRCEERENVQWELRKQEIREGKIDIISKEKHILAANAVPSCLPENDANNVILYYDKEIFQCFLQAYSYSDFVISGGVCGITINDGLEDYLRTNGKIQISYFINNKGNQLLVQRCKNAQFRERYCLAEKGLYDKYTFYVIRIKPTSSSLGALMHWVLENLEIADKKGYIPVVDFSLQNSQLLEDDEVGKINPWDSYFEQPTQFGIQAVHHAKNVVYCNACAEYEFDEFLDDAEKQNRFFSLYEKYIHISKRIEKKSITIYKNIIKPEWRVLGVVYRGTDYKNKRVINEHRQPDINELIDKAKELMAEWNCNHIFLATEDKGAVEIFERIFGDILVYTEKERYESNVIFTQVHSFDREFDTYLKGEEYLTEMFILSKCNCLLSSRIGLLAVVLPMNAGKYENTYIYDLGKYTEADYI